MSFAPALFLIALTQQQVNKDIENSLRSFVQATLAYDVASLEKLVDKDYTEVSPLGEVDPHDKFLSYYRVPKDQQVRQPKLFTFSEMNLKFPTRDFAVAIYLEKLNFGTEQAPREMSVRVTTTLKKVKGKWLLFSNHYTGIRPKQ
jgi:ketosteroid isomerase-like protein